MNDFTRDLLAGGAAGFAVDISLFPIDTVKTRLQAKEGFIKSGGFRGLYRERGYAHDNRILYIILSKIILF